ncbi:MAG: metal ABC transporter permease [Planctomycetes bacterium]|nr:metal ABC transporter permease [Planctomycetota bacterium]
MSDWLLGTPLAPIPGAVAAGIVAGTLLPLLGMWVVLQRVVFLGITLAQLAAAGVALGLVLGLPALTMGALLTAAGVVGLTAAGRGRVADAGDSQLGALFCVASALALLFVSRSAGDLDQVDHVLHGNLVYADMDDVRIVGATLLLCVLATLATFPRILFCTFDPDTATALGLKAPRWLLFLFFVLAAALSVSMRTTGSLLTFAMLVLPPLAALQLKRGLRTSFVLASTLGLVGTLAGLFVAVSADLHVESSIVVTLFATFAVCSGFARRWWIGTALLAACVGGGVLLAQDGVSEPSAHEHLHDMAAEDASGESHAPYHLDLELAGRATPEGDLAVSWTLDVHCVTGPDALPPQLWLVLTGDGGLSEEHELLHEMQSLPVGDSRHTGTFGVPGQGGVHRIDGQLWTGSLEGADSLPLEPERFAVLGADVQR